MVVFDGAAAGCAVSTSITRGVMLVLLVVYMTFSSQHSEAFAELKSGLIQYIHKHKNELLRLKEKINNNESTNGSTSSRKTPAALDSSINSESNGLEMTDANSTHGEVGDDQDEDEDEDDTDTLLSSNNNSRQRSNAGRFSNLYQTKKKILLFLSLGIPGGLVLIVELWTFDIATIIVSQIGTLSIIC
jgi:hypothetical protein